VKLILPVDVVVASAIENVDSNTVIKTVDVDAIPSEFIGVDIGPKTVALFAAEIEKAKTIIWNGPLGVFEVEAFSHGTIEVAKAIAETDSLSIVGGGDTVVAAELSGAADKITHLSTGGGASLEFLGGKELPGIAALDDK
jgi:phosphoglycerate kinase